MNNASEINNMDTENTNISFERKLSGYDKGQVDRYIKTLAEAYQTLYDEYNAKCAGYDALMNKIRLDEAREQSKQGEVQEQSKQNAEAITKTLLNAETLARQVIDDANAEAANIDYQARLDAKTRLDEAETESANIKIRAQKILDDARAEAAAIQERHKEIIDDAHGEAAHITMRAKVNAEQTDRYIKAAIKKLQGLLADDILDTGNEIGKETQPLIRIGASR